MGSPSRLARLLEDKEILVSTREGLLIWTFPIPIVVNVAKTSPHLISIDLVSFLLVVEEGLQSGKHDSDQWNTLMI